MNDKPKCLTCRFFDHESGFCRVDRPIPTLMYSKEGGRPVIKSLFPQIEKPEKDYCARHESSTLND